MRVRVATVAALLALTSCSILPPAPQEGDPQSPDARTHWELSFRVSAPGMSVVGYHIGQFDESVSVATQGSAVGEECFASRSRPGQGGPENKVGEQIETTVDGHRAIRNGAGAEADYLMWQLPDSTWMEVNCGRDEPRRTIDDVAAAVEILPMPVAVPFAFELPRGHAISIIMVDLRAPSAQVYFGAEKGPSGLPESDLMVSLDAPDRQPTRLGDPTTIGGRPALVNRDSRFPAVWLDVRGSWIQFAITPSDTGPYPDRSADLLVLQSVAESLRPADQVADPNRWLDAAGVFG